MYTFISYNSLNFISKPSLLCYHKCFVDMFKYVSNCPFSVSMNIPLLSRMPFIGR